MSEQLTEAALREVLDALNVIEEAARFVSEKLGDNGYEHYYQYLGSKSFAVTINIHLDNEKSNVERLLGELVYGKPDVSLFDRLMKAKCKKDD